jgi:GT2 family glycosyltransferase
VEPVSAIVVSHNSRRYLERCLAAVVPQVAQTIVVDAASTDGSADLVAEAFRAVELRRLTENGGYGAALNDGARVATQPFLLLLNADTELRQSCARRLVEALRGDDRVGVAGPRLLNEDGTTQQSVRGFPTPWRLATEYFFLRHLAPRSRALNAFYASGFAHDTQRGAEFLVGAALLVRRTAFDAVGGFDDTFFMYDEEVDLCFRLAQAGWPAVFVPGAECVHVGGASTRAVAERMYLEQLRSHLLFLRKHRGRAAAERARRVILWSMRLRRLVFATNPERRRLSAAGARWAASGDADALVESRGYFS